MKQSTLPDTLAQADVVVCSIRSTKTSVASIALLWLAATACGFPRPSDLVGDAPGGSDGSAGSAVTIHVSPSGDDANDGLTSPVKTLKRALGIAVDSSQVSVIALATGRYSEDDGEAFPYMVPAKLMIVGPAGGGAVLAGHTTGPALVLRDASLQDLEFEDFSVAVDAIGSAAVSNVRVRSTMTAVRGHAGAVLTIDNLDITGTASACASGIILNDTAALKATVLTTRGLGTSLDSEDQSTSDLTKVNITGDLGCARPVINVTSGMTFSLSDSLLDGGNGGLSLGSSTPGVQTQATLTDVTIHNMKSSALNIGQASVFMLGGELSLNSMSSTVVSVVNASLSMRRVVFNQNFATGLFAQSAQLVMRECNVSKGGGAIDVSVINPSFTDLGTVMSPGGNTFQDDLTIEGSDFTPLREVDAIGNTWNPDVQGADHAGQYAPTLVIAGSTNGIFGPNYVLTGNMISLRL